MIDGSTVWLLAGRAVLLEQTRTLLVADMHLGREHAWYRSGLPIGGGAAEQSLDDALGRLRALIESERPERLLVLGDLLHAPCGLTAEMIERVGVWRRANRLCVQLVPGNHDRALDAVVGPWNLEVLGPSVVEGSFVFTHGDADAEFPGAVAVFRGHTHPMVTIAGRGDGVRLPCFHRSGRTITLPAFSGRMSGHAVRPGPGDSVYAIAQDALIDVSRQAGAGAVPDRRTAAASRD